jgi:Kef-type K+ transport system membrane component KefB
VQLHWLLAIILITAKLFGAVARRWGLPSVVGEIGAGVLLGPSLLGLIELPAHGAEGDPLFGLAQIGLCVLLFRVGLETDLDRARQVARPAAALAVGGMVFPMLLGVLGASALGVPPLQAAFVGATLTATSIGITAAVLDELGAGSTRGATLILGAAVMDNVLGLVLLAALVGTSSAQNALWVDIGIAVAQAVGFLAAALWLGRPLTRALLYLTRWTGSRSTLLVFVFSALLLAAWGAKTAGLEMIIGAYATGLALARHPERDSLNTEFEPLIDLLTPVFFVLIGSAIALEALTLNTPTGRFTLGLAGVLFIAAVAGKLLAPMTVRKLGIPTLAVGAALVPRGEVGLIFAQVGLSEGVLTPDLFGALALVITATTVAGPVLLRRLWLRGQQPPA